MLKFVCVMLAVTIPVKAGPAPGFPLAVNVPCLSGGRTGRTSTVPTCTSGLFGNNCGSVPRTACAVVYDDGDCGGWALEIAEGRIRFPIYHPTYYWYRNDIESVSVRAGCTFTGFEDSDYNGESATIVAGNRDRHVTLDDEDEYEDLDEDIESIICRCN